MSKNSDENIGKQSADDVQERLLNLLAEKLQGIPSNEEILARAEKQSLSVQALVKMYLAKEMRFLALSVARKAEGQSDDR